jgi:tetratricopeptide (TPR) repeat protein
MNDFPPSIAELTTRYLAREDGVENTTRPVETYDAVPSAAVDPRQAWDGAVAGVAGAEVSVKMPTGWSAVVASLDSMAAVPMAAGNFPQAVRDWAPLVQARRLSETRPAASVPIDVPGLAGWCDSASRSGDATKRMLAAGTLRLARKFDQAEQILQGEAPVGLETEWANERAALAWHQGRYDEARAIWESLPETTATLFNRGLAALFADDAESAIPLFHAAAARLPEDSVWRHLACFYLALAQSR